MQIEKSQPDGKPDGKWIMPETRFRHFPALSVDLRFKVSRSASEINVLLFFLPMTLKNVKYHSSFLLFMTFYVA